MPASRWHIGFNSAFKGLRKVTEPGRYPQFWRLNLLDLGRIEIGIRVEKMIMGQENKVVRKAVARTWL
jgi:hypothetical protein